MVEGNGLENRRAGNGTVGSNPTLSANKINRGLYATIYFILDGDGFKTDSPGDCPGPLPKKVLLAF